VPYPEIVARVCDRINTLEELGNPLLVVEQTEVGRPMFDLSRLARLQTCPVTIATSATSQAKRDPKFGDWTVPKKDLVGALQTLAFSGGLPIARSLKEARTLTQELEHFRTKYTHSANVTYEVWRERDHDDLVLAVALASWASFLGYKAGGLI
jgi:hypothetical protein